MKWFTKKQNPASPYHPHYTKIILQSIVFLCIIIVLLIPLIRKLKTTQTELAAAESETQRASETVISQQQAAQYVEDIEQHELLNNGLLAEEEIIEFIETLESAADHNNVVHTIELQNAQRKTENGVTSIPAQLTVSGSWDDTIHFLSEIEQEYFYLNPQIIDITHQSLPEPKEIIQIQLLTYWRAQ